MMKREFEMDSKKAWVEYDGGNTAVVRCTGGNDGIWMTVFVDKLFGNISISSAVGSYSIIQCNLDKDMDIALAQAAGLLGATDEKRILYRLVDKPNRIKLFDRGTTIDKLLALAEARGYSKEEVERLDDILEEDDYDSLEGFEARMVCEADNAEIELPEGWWDCFTEKYTPFQIDAAQTIAKYIFPAIIAHIGGRDKVESVQ